MIHLNKFITFIDLLANSIGKWDLKNLKTVELDNLLGKNKEGFQTFCKTVIANIKEDINMKNGKSNDIAVFEILKHSYNATKIYDIDNTCDEPEGGFHFKSIQPHKGEIYGYNTIKLDSAYVINYFKDYISGQSNNKMFGNLKELHICQNTADSDEIMQKWRDTLSKDGVIKTGLDLGIENNDIPYFSDDSYNDYDDYYDQNEAEAEGEDNYNNGSQENDSDHENDINNENEQAGLNDEHDTSNLNNTNQ